MANPKLNPYESQQLRFYNKTQQAIDIGNRIFNLKNMGFADYFMFSDVKDLIYIPYCWPVENGDSVLVQFPTTYSTFTLTLIKTNPYTETNYTGQAQLFTTYEDTDGDTVNVYNVPIDVSSLTGEYYFKIVGNTSGFPPVEYWSEPFNVQSRYEETLLIKSGGNSTKNDGMFWSLTPYTIDDDLYQYLRIEAKLWKQSFDPGQNTYDDSDTELTTLRVYPTATHVLSIKKVPWFIYEKLILAIGHDEFWANEILFNTAEDFEITEYPEQAYVSISIPLREVVYQENTVMPILTGDPLPVQGKGLYGAEGKALFGAVGKAIGQY